MDFKTPITLGLQQFFTEISNDFNIPENELHKKYLADNSKKNDRNPSGYMLFVKQMHENQDNVTDNITFTDKSKIIGDKWKNLTDEEKLKYKQIANNFIKPEKKCTKVKNDVICNNFIYNDTGFCKKHYKANLKSQQTLEKSDNVSDNYTKFNNFTVDIIIIDNNTFYKDEFGNIFKMLEDGSGELIET